MSLAHTCLQDVTKVSQEGHVTHLPAVDELFPLGLESFGFGLLGFELLLPEG